MARVKELLASSSRFEDTGETIKIEGRDRPVMRMGKLLFVGEDLCTLNPSGAPGRVWAASTKDKLIHNVYATLRERDRDGTGH